jgi:hypothetical protein
MSRPPTSEVREAEAVSLRKSAARGEKPRSGWAAEETVPLRVSTDRTEAEERAARLRLVAGRHLRLR